MPNIKRVNPPGMKDPSDYGFTQAVIVPPESKLVYIAGQGGADENGNYGSFIEQMERAFTNLETVLKAVGSSPKDVVKITILSVEHDERQLGLISAKRRSFWGDRKPASTLIPVPRLASDGMLFEIDAIAVVSHS